MNKLWGTTRQVVDHPSNTAHRITVVPGGYCSLHHHRRKHNVFVGVKGVLTIETVLLGEQVHRTLLGPGEVFDVGPDIKHRFINESKEEVEAVEYYYPESLSEDIEREDEGGIRR